MARSDGSASGNCGAKAAGSGSPLVLVDDTAEDVVATDRPTGTRPEVRLGYGEVEGSLGTSRRPGPSPRWFSRI
jgi:hypothetical protein